MTAPLACGRLPIPSNLLVQFTLPGIESAQDAAKAAGAVLEAVAPLSHASRTKRAKPSRRGLQRASQGSIGTP
jgi:hypothetical protein